MKIIAASAGLDEALEILKTGGVIAHATETCYGLACDLGNTSAVEKLFAIKKRPRDQPVSALFATVEDAKKWVEWNEEAEKLALEYLPGPLTVILPIWKDCIGKIFPVGAVRERPLRQTLGIRISSHPVATALAKNFGSPLSTTSANLHGQKNPYSAEEIREQFENENMKPDLILDSGTLPPVPPSTVINLTEKEGVTMRKGSIEM